MTDHDYFGHPIFSSTQFRIMTPAVLELQNTLTSLVWTGATGASLFGFTRAGKSTAVELVTNMIKARSGHAIPIVRYEAHRRDHSTIRALYESLFSHLDLAYKPSHKTEVLVNNLLTHLAETATSHYVDQLVMVIDEAQRLAIPQIDVFAELDDRLRKEYFISLMCLFVGNQEQMGRLLDEVKKGENEHIEGRFFRQTFRFYGLRSVKEVRYCLEQYDTLHHPSAGPTYTEYFLPDAYAAGFRLASLAPSMWSEYRLCQRQWHLHDWPMDAFVRAVKLLLVDYLPKFGPQAYSARMFRSCLNVSGLIPDVGNAEAFA